jgi:hypothetical protein
VRQTIQLHLHRRGDAEGCTDDEKPGLQAMQGKTKVPFRKVIFRRHYLRHKETGTFKEIRRAKSTYPETVAYRQHFRDMFFYPCSPVPNMV